MILLAAFVSFLSLIVTVAKLGPHWVKRMFGYDYLVDITLMLFMGVMFISTQSISGTLIALMSNFVIGLGLWFGRNIYGYQVLERRGMKLIWVEYPGQWVTDALSPFKRVAAIRVPRPSFPDLRKPIFTFISVFLLLSALGILLLNVVAYILIY